VIRDAVDVRKGLTVNDDRTHPPPTVLLTLDEAAAFLRTSVATLRYWRHLGIGPAGFRLGRRVLYRRDDLEQWVADRRDAETQGQARTSPA
jgi:excisionase family DNA binding protein